jgi:hypothetical protein
MLHLVKQFDLPAHSENMGLEAAASASRTHR